MRLARSRSLASPITRGRQIVYISASPSAFIVTSGPMPAASPMVMPTTGLATSPVSFQLLQRVYQRVFRAECAGLGHRQERARSLADETAQRHARFDLCQQLNPIDAEMAADRACRVAAGQDQST